MILGTLVGVLPGIGPALTIALLLPITFNFDDPVGAFILFAGIYAGGMYGGSTTSILLNTPGESSSVATAIEGFEMAKRGRGRAALATAAIGSFVAGTIGIVLLTLLAEPVASLAVKFRAEDYFALTLLAFASVTALTSRSLIRGFTSLAVGLLIGFVGIDQLTGQSRLTFGVDQLGNGIDIVIVAVGLFAVGEALHMAARLRSGAGEEEEVLPVEGEGRYLSRTDWRRSWKPWLRGAGIGFPFGALPAGGAEVPTFLSLCDRAPAQQGRRVGRGRDRGRGRARGGQQRVVLGDAGAAADAGDPDVGDRGDHARRLPDLQPAARPGAVRAQQRARVDADRVALRGQRDAAAAQPAAVQVWVRVLDIPRPLLYSGILVFGTLGVYSLSGSTIDVIVMYAIGVMGFFMRRYDFPIAPVILGVILGPLMETQARRALVASGDDFGVFFGRPLTVILLLFAVAAFILPHLGALKNRTFSDED